MNTPFPSRERENTQNITPSPGGRELEGGGNIFVVRPLRAVLVDLPEAKASGYVGPAGA